MRLNRKLLDRAVRILGAKSRSETIDTALRQFLVAHKSAKPSNSKIESPPHPGID
jgi:metal-responsive CopG/Arc/MetJ family transcriptional regulator